VLGWAKRAINWLQRSRPFRVFTRYTQNHGELLAGGMSVSALFSVFAALYVGFAIAGIALQSSPDLRDAFVSMVSISVPGLIDTGHGGAINLDDLLETRILGWSGIVAVVVLTLTALGWLGATRDAVRAIFGLSAQKAFFLLLKLKDLGLIIGFGAVMIISAALTVGSTSALTFVLGALGADKVAFTQAAVRVVVLLIVLALDTAVLATLFRVLSGVLIPWRRLLAGSLLGGIALGILKVLGSVLLGGAGRNPLLASFAIIVGLLIWFSLICRIILLAASWIAVDMTEHGLTGAKLAAVGSTPVSRGSSAASRPR
jgi:membrane protein